MAVRPEDAARQIAVPGLWPPAHDSGPTITLNGQANLSINALMQYAALICLSWNTSSDELGRVDQRKALGIVTTLEIERLFLGGVDTRHLPGV